MEPRVSTTGHVQATAAGEIPFTVVAPAGCAATLTLRSQRRIPSRWLERGRPRFVTLARRTVTPPASGRVKVTARLRPEHLALLRRMGTIRAVACVETAQSRSRTAVAVHAPRRRKRGRIPA